MNRQSDFGYVTGGIEHRTPELCMRRAALCERMAAAFPDRADHYIAWAREWRTEAAATA